MDGAAEPLAALQMLGYLAGHSGFARHTQEVIREFVDIGIEVEVGSIVGEPPERWTPWLRPLARPVPAAGLSFQVCPPHQIRWECGKPVVNYTTFEGDRIHPEWVAIAERTARTIVTTRQCRDAWVGSGAPADRIGVANLGVDAIRFDGRATPPDLRLPDGDRLADRRVRLLHVSTAGPRKNHLGLIRAWLEATTPADDAALVLRIGDCWPGSNQEVANSLRRAQQAARKRLADAAPVLWLDRALPEEEMPGLYAAATHYLSASCGEGWDLAAIEAAASGLTMIVPDHTAYREYLDPAVATMIPSGLERNTMPNRGEFGRFFADVHWWRPNHAALVGAIRAAVRGDALPRGAQARVRTDFTWEATAIRLLGELARVEMG